MLVAVTLQVIVLYACLFAMPPMHVLCRDICVTPPCDAALARAAGTLATRCCSEASLCAAQLRRSACVQQAAASRPRRCRTWCAAGRPEHVVLQAGTPNPQQGHLLQRCGHQGPGVTDGQHLPQPPPHPTACLRRWWLASVCTMQGLRTRTGRRLSRSFSAKTSWWVTR